MDSRDPRDDIVDFLKGLFPLKLAESWDNVGVLVDPRLPGEMVPADLPTNVLLTIDMTERVVEEAIEKGCNMIVAYHPSPFTSFKKVSSRNITQKLVLKCIKNNILVYSPHTACDNASGGVNDWLASGVIAPQMYAWTPDRCGITEQDGKNIQAIPENPGDILHTISPIVSLEDIEHGAGRGRLVTLQEPQNLWSVVIRFKLHFGLRRVRFALGNSLTMSNATVRTVAVQAGSGGSVLKDVQADLFVTGEMSHHDILAANAKGISVLLAEHSNSERPFLYMLLEKLSKSFKPPRSFAVSENDSDPIDIV